MGSFQLLHFCIYSQSSCRTELFKSIFIKVLDPSTYTTPSISDADPNVNDLVNSLSATHSWLYYVVPVLFISLFLYVIDFYMTAYVAQRTDSSYAARFGAVFVFTASIGLSFVWNHPHVVKVMVMDKIKTIIEQEHALSGGVIISYFLYLLGILIYKYLSKY